MTSTDKKLELNMVLYRDLLQIPVQDNNEALTPLDSTRIQYGYRAPFTDMKDALNGSMLVRASLADRLYRADNTLRSTDNRLRLMICYGYRSPVVQELRFTWMIRQLAERYYEDPLELYEAAHRRVAVPSVAGHPTGGAVDITIIYAKTGTELDFGSTMYDYATKRQYVFYPGISEEQRRNRMLLRATMMEEGFAPYDGEWWHFSYGDREWAYYYSQPSACYGRCDA